MCLLARTSSIKSAFLFLCFPGFREEPFLFHGHGIRPWQPSAVNAQYDADEEPPIWVLVIAGL
ncbi:hypothetical protein CJF36_22835 [Pseudomonas lundensis]|nr:hypothetical protein CJF36_22835 [Pseudomonas lundensis]